MTLCLSRNNPGCILPNPANPWKGMAAVQPPGPVAFISVIYGIRALYKILESYERDGIDTLGAAIARWSPPSSNDTAAYVSDVCQRCGVDPDVSVSLTAMAPAIIKAICYHENGICPLDDEQISAGIEAASG